MLPAVPRLQGRNDLVETLLKQLEAARVVTLWGPGGIGKTSVLLAAAHALGRAEDAIFVSLAAAADVVGVLRATAQAVGVTEATIEAVGKGLRARDAPLLLLDNAEQVVAATAQLVRDCLALAPNARFLVTSREPLAIVDEVVIAVPPLGVSDAGALLLERSRALRTIPEGPMRALVLATEGIPLAIELCAAGLEVLSAEELAARLARGEPLMESPRRDIDERHRTLSRSIAASLRLLDDDERLALDALTVIRGDFDVEAAEAVIGSTGARPPAVLLRALVRKALLRDRGLQSATPRFGWFEAIRTEVKTALDESGAAARAARSRHAAYFADRGERLASRLSSKDAPQAQAGLAAIAEDLRAVVERAPESPRQVTAACEALAEHVAVHGPLGSFVDLAQRLLAAHGGPTQWPAVARALAQVHYLMGKFEEAGALVDAVLPITIEPSEERAQLLRLRGMLLVKVGAKAEAISVLEEGYALAESLGATRIQGACALGLSATHRLEQSVPETQQWLERAFAQLREAGDIRLEGRALCHLAFATCDEGDWASARADFQNALAMFERLGDPRLAAHARAYVGNTLRAEGRIAEALVAYDAAIPVLERMGDEYEGVFRMDRATGWLLIGEWALARAELARTEEQIQPVDHLLLALVRGYAIAAAALGGDVPEARAALARARAHPAIDQVARLARAAFDLHAHQVEVDEALSVERRSELRAEASRWLASREQGSEHVRIAARLLHTALDRAHPPDDALVLDFAAMRARLPRKESWIDLEPHGSAARLLAALVEAHASGTGPLPTSAMLEAGWPGERVAPQAGALRVRVTVSQLRKLGFRNLLLHRADGYYLDPDVRIVRRSK